MKQGKQVVKSIEHTQTFSLDSEPLPEASVDLKVISMEGATDIQVSKHHAFNDLKDELD